MNVLLSNPSLSIDARFALACQLAQEGRTEEAKGAYLTLLEDAPTHFGALNNLGSLLFLTGYKSAARTVFSQAVVSHPDNPEGHVSLANLLAMNGEADSAMLHFETALRLAPDHVVANRGMAFLLTERGDEDRAAPFRDKGYRQQPVLNLPYTGNGEPVRMLLLTSTSGRMLRMRHHLDERVFEVSVVFVDYFDLSTPLPPHQFVFNSIGDADLGRPVLEATARLLEKTTAPVINHPDRVMLTGRAENARWLADIPGLITPRMSLLPRVLLEGAGAGETLQSNGFEFPMLLRAPGFHTGRFFVRVDRLDDIPAALREMPGDQVLVMNYLDARASDNKIRKYRAMMIDGQLYPLHAAISHDWKIHYFTAEMADNPEHRAEDAAFLDNMAGVIGATAMAALQEVQRTLGLDYGGIDFGLNSAGEVILFEANASMVVLPPDKDTRWDYRRPAVDRVLNAIRGLLTKHAN